MGGEVLFALAVAGFPRDMPNVDHRGGLSRRRREGGRGGRGHRRRPHGRGQRAQVRPVRDGARASRPDPDQGRLAAGRSPVSLEAPGHGRHHHRGQGGRAPTQAALCTARWPRCCASIAPRPRWPARAAPAGPPTSRASGCWATSRRWSRPRAPACVIQASRLPLLPGAHGPRGRGPLQRGHVPEPPARGDRAWRAPGHPPRHRGPPAGLLFEAETSGGLLFSVAREPRRRRGSRRAASAGRSSPRSARSSASAPFTSYRRIGSARPEPSADVRR